MHHGTRGIRSSSSNLLGSSSSINAAALQADMAKKYNLGKNRSRLTSNNTRNRSILSNTCGSCGAVVINGGSNRICQSCGYFLDSLITPTESLSQRIGIVPIPPKVEILSESQWEVIETSIARRDPDSRCPICMEGFNQGYEVLLSCSHMFHRSCLRAFEKFVKNAQFMCPICRTCNYQKKVTHVGTRAYEKVCVVKIQCWVRGCLARRQFKIRLKSFYREGGGEKRQRKRYYEAEFSSITKKLNQNFETRNEQVDEMLSSVDHTINSNRELDLLFEQMLFQRSRLNQGEATAVEEAPVQFTPVISFPPRPQTAGDAFCEHTQMYWKDIQTMAEGRGVCDCAICMSPMLPNVAPKDTCLPVTVVSNRTVVVLSCSHTFHEQCLVNFENFVEGIKICPVCRSGYSRKEFFVQNESYYDGNTDTLLIPKHLNI